MLVNRDAAFIGLLGIALDPEVPRWKKATCCNPLTNPFPVADDHPAVIHAAAATVCGLATKLDDDFCDEGIFRRGLARIGGVIVSPAAGRAVAILNSSSFPTAQVMESLASQKVLEASDPARVDEPTAFAYGTISSHLSVLLDVPKQRDALRRTGAALGSLVYWRDAWQDRREDASRGRFNPFACLDEEQIRQRIASAWSEFSASLTEMGFQRHAGLIVGIQSATGRTRDSFLNLLSDEALKKEKRKRIPNEKKRDSSWWNCCDCCDCCSCPTSRKGSCCDAACDCGPGDTGCCDCNPCDGCDCCPCN
jgi:hypothetical protein